MSNFSGRIYVQSDLNLIRKAYDEKDEKTKKAILPVVAGMAFVFYREVQRGPGAARIGTKTGNLRKSVYRAFFRRESDFDRWLAVYGVGIRKKKARGSGLPSAPHITLLQEGWTIKRWRFKDQSGRWFTRSLLRSNAKKISGKPFFSAAVSAAQERAAKKGEDELMKIAWRE